MLNHQLLSILIVIRSFQLLSKLVTFRLMRAMANSEFRAALRSRQLLDSVFLRKFNPSIFFMNLEPCCARIKLGLLLDMISWLG